MAEVVGNIVFILLLVFLNGFFVAAEFAIVKVRRSQLEEKIRQGNRDAVLAKHIVDHLSVYLSATQLGITFASLGLGWLGEPLIAKMFADTFHALGITSERAVSTISVIIGFGILTFLQIIFGELAPKFLAIRNPEGTSYLVSLPLQLFFKVFRPVIWTLNATSNFLLKKLGIPITGPGDLVHSAEELEIIVNEGAKSGVLNKTEQELISSIFDFTETLAREIMIPRTEMVAVNIDTSREALVHKVSEEGYSRMPVYKESLDNIIGIIYTKDLITLLEYRDLIVLQDIVRPAYFVPESVMISKLMRDLQERKLHMAIVIDEFGGTQGLITMEDILEEIVGEIHDEYDEIVKEVEHAADGSALVDARIDIKDFNEKFAAAIPEDPEYETLNGFLSKITGKIPEIKEEIDYENLHFTILKKSQRRIRQVRVKKKGENPVKVPL
jgi:CBS domain containing-hemolysin-like protein